MPQVKANGLDLESLGDEAAEPFRLIMGRDLPAALHDTIADAMARVASRARVTAQA